MKALQLHYTSCRRGCSGSAGFQTRSCSEGITPEEQREIERQGAYRPPRDVEREPSPEQIALDFPRALRFYTLSSGRQALTLSSYSGRDYSGRWGNFFAHTLVLEPGALGDLWPVDLYEWTGWKARLEDGEDGEGAPPPLPAHELEGVAPAESFRLAELSAFLRGQDDGVAFLARLTRALLASRTDSRPVVVRDRPIEALYWIACVLKLFPPRHARTLTLSTYQDDPRSCGDLNASSGETDFVWSEAEARYRFYLFDRHSGLASELAESSEDYAAITARWLAEQPARLERFHAFLGLFRHEGIDLGLASALDLFLLREDPRSLPRSERLARMVRFAAEHGSDPARLEILGSLEQAAVAVEAELEAGDLELLARNFAEGAQLTGEAKYRTAALRTAGALLARLTTEAPSISEAVERVWQRVGELLPGADGELSVQALALVQSPARPPARAALGRALAVRLAQLPAAAAGEIRRSLEAAGGDALLLAEWSVLVAAAQDPMAAFERYRREVLGLLPGYARRQSTPVRLGLLSALPEPQRQTLALRWLQAGEVEGSEPDLVRHCLELANRALPLALDKKTRQWADLLADVARRHKVVLRPDRPRIVLALAASQLSPIELASADWAGLAADLSMLGTKEYETFVESLLPPALERARIAREHGRVLTATFRRDQLETFLPVYQRFFRNGRKDPWPEPVQAALRFWLTFDPRGEGGTSLEVLELPARDLLSAALARLPPEHLERVERKVRQARLEPRAEALWQRLYQGATSAKGYRLRRWLGARFQQLNPFARR